MSPTPWVVCRLWAMYLETWVEWVGGLIELLYRYTRED